MLVRSSNNTIGEALTGGGNVIAGNGATGVLITAGPTVQGNQLLGNFIGTDLGTADGLIVKGTIAVSQPGRGRPDPGLAPELRRRVERRPRGTSSARTRATASRSSARRSTGNHVLNNYIGFNIVNGLIVYLPNQNGISITSPGNVIGDPTGGSPNTISDNYNHGILLSGASASGNTIAGNVIGLNPSGGSAFPNAFDGIHLDNAPNNLIGGTTPGARNTISSNNNGVYLSAPARPATWSGQLHRHRGRRRNQPGQRGRRRGARQRPVEHHRRHGDRRGQRDLGQQPRRPDHRAGSTGNLVQGNFIGTDLFGQAIITNKIDGVFVTLGASINTIGGVRLAGAGNTIAFNVGAGVNLDGGTRQLGARATAIFSNILAGIVLNPLAMANNLQPAPVLTGVAPNTTSTSIQGTLTAASNTTYTIQFFASAAQPAPGFEQGQTPLYTTLVTTNGTGQALIAQRVPQAIAVGTVGHGHGDRPPGNTSAFSVRVRAVPVGVQFSAPTYTVSESGHSVLDHREPDRGLQRRRYGRLYGRRRDGRRGGRLRARLRHSGL